MAYMIQGLAWICLYVAVAVTPLFVLLLGPTPVGRGFWWEFHVAVAFAGASVMGTMFYLTARFKRAMSPFGMDIVYYFHRWVAIVAALLVAVHVGLVFAANPDMVSVLAIPVMPMSMRTGVVAAAALAVLVVTSFWRKKLGLDYEVWRLWHAFFAVVAVTFAIIHMELVGYYVSAPWKRLFWMALGISWVGSLAFMYLIKPIRLLRRPYHVAEVRRERGRSWTLVLEPDGHDGLRFSAGQFAWLTLGRSPFALEEHPFSLASSSGKTGQVELTIKELGDFTSRIGEVLPGERAYLDGPYGTFCPDRHDAQGYVLIAGGIGIAPIMSILRTFADRGDKREVVLLYGAETIQDMTFLEELEKLGERMRLCFVPVPVQPPDGWQGETGFPDEAMIARYLPDFRGSCEYFVCGPAPMKEAVEKALNRQRVPLEKVHSELFDWV